MRNTLKLSFALKNTYRVNSILYALKQIPLLKRALPESLYGVRGFKVFANFLSALWELISLFLGKFLYLALMVAGACKLYETLPQGQLYWHILLCLTVVGAFLNTHLFNPTRDKYYAMILLRMDARQYTLVNYSYALCKGIVGFLPLSLWFGLRCGADLWLCCLFPFSAAGLKLGVAAFSLWDYEQRGKVANENNINKTHWLIIGLPLFAAYGLPATDLVLPADGAAAFLLACLPIGAVGLWKVLRFGEYRAVNQQLLARLNNQMDTTALAQQLSQKNISADAGITSRKKGFEYLNDLFVKRHRKILWQASKRVAGVCLLLVLGVLLLFYWNPEVKPAVNGALLSYLPYFVFILYAINRGSSFTKALFLNCDHSLLAYTFYRQKDAVLKLFCIRLREIVKVNLLPAAVLGAGLPVLLYASGGTDDPWNYAVLLCSILSLSVFFSIHYLTAYYLLQPYSAGTEMKSVAYQLVMSATYFVCLFLMQFKLPTAWFGGLCIAFCVLYSGAACLLVYRLAPRTFRLRV